MTRLEYNYTGNPCVIFAEQQGLMLKLRLAAGVLAFALCVTAGIIILCCKLYRTLTQRLYGYLTLANIAFSLVFLFQFVAENPVEQVVYHIPCVIAGVLKMYVGWVVLILTTAITIHLFLIIVCYKSYTSKRIDAFHIGFSIGFPLLFFWVPLINDSYGLSVNFCWIKWADYEHVDPNSTVCPLLIEGVVEKLLLWSGPMAIVVLVSFGLVLIMLGALIKRYWDQRTYKNLSKQNIRALREAIPFLTFPILFYIICIIEIANHIQQAIYFPNPSFGLWFIDSLSAPFRAVPVILALLCPGMIIKCKRRKDHELKACEDVDTHIEPGDERALTSAAITSYSMVSKPE